jgi:5'-phosphate synthase pdxT subunit
LAPAEVGVLALQGDFAEHAAMLRRVGVKPREVRLPAHLEGLAGLIIPGGESTTMGRLLVTYDLLEPIRRMGAGGLPIWGTCAGLILMANDVGREQPLLGLMDMRVERNAFGRQTDSFETDIRVDGLEGGPLAAVFIRAPIIREVGRGVEVLARLADDSIVAARKEQFLVTAFHPELTGDTRMHEFFCAMAAPV